MPLLNQHGVPADCAALAIYLFTTVLDGRNAYLTDGVQRALCFEASASDFTAYVQEIAATGA